MKKAFYCSDCKKCGMIDIKHKCKRCDLTLASRKYNNHCAFCFINPFPNDPKSIEAKGSKM